MTNKDITEKILEDYNDVFADIINTILFKGEQRVMPSALEDLAVHSQYRANDAAIHEQERDVLKRWKDCNVELAICGIENQTKIERNMPFRIMAYDGAAYRSQLLEHQEQMLPVVTLVLYFGTNKRWDQPIRLKELLSIPEGMEEYINDYKIIVVNVAWLTDNQIEMFQSDFKVVAKFFCEKRKDKDYISKDRQTIKHVDEVLKLLSVMTGDRRYEEILAMPGREVKSMCDVAERLENRGRMEGREEGQNALVKAVECLRQGKSDKDILALGIDEKTLALAKTIK